MAMPMRLVVRLHMRRSARAGVASALDIITVIPAAAKRRAGIQPRGPTPWVPDSRVPRLPGRPRRGLSAHKDDAAVIDVGSGRSAGDKVGETLEEARRIVLGEKRRRVEPERPRALERGVVDDRAGGVV